MKIESKLVEAHIFRRIDGKVEFLALKRSKESYYPNIWQMVTGAIKKNEKAYECAIREIKEETGLSPIKLWALPNVNSYYSASEDAIILIPVFAAEIGNSCEVAISNEHSEYEWMDKTKFISCLAWPGQKKSVEVLYEYFFDENQYIYLIEIKNN